MCLGAMHSERQETFPFFRDERAIVFEVLDPIAILDHETHWHASGIVD